MYEGGTEPTILYPTNYSLKSDNERRVEAKENLELMTVIPSTTYQKAIAKEVARIMVGTVLSKEDFEKVIGEIEAAAVVNTDSETLREDHESGFVSTELASTLRGYPAGEVEKAKLDHAERAGRIAAAQGEVGGQARGVDDIDISNQSGEKEKELAASKDLEAPNQR